MGPAPVSGTTDGKGSANPSSGPRPANGITTPGDSPAARAANGNGSAGSNSGSSVRNVRTRPGPESSGVSNRTVTRPNPLPCTHPCPNPA
jgi:hypothetical protein